MKFLAAAFLSIQYSAYKPELVFHIALGSQLEQEPVFDHHLEIERIAGIIIGDVGKPLTNQFFSNHRQRLNLRQQL